jgi:CRISPR/Cas system-associated endoribonuclease Cas2
MKEATKDEILGLIYGYEKTLSFCSIKGAILFDYYKIKEKEHRDFERAKKEKKKIERIFYYLQKASYIKVNQENVFLTNKGTLSLLLSKSKKIKKEKNKKYYYLVIFDIPEKMRRARDLLRRVLYNFGSDRLQKSVFTIESEEGYKLIKNLVKQSKIGDYVKIIKCFR